MGPPLSTSPSFSSFDSYGSHFEANRLRHLLNASHDDLALQRQHFEERERRQLEQFEAERRMYETRIRELTEEVKGRGSGRGSSRRG